MTAVDADVVIAGGGPAGLATAIRVRQEGLGAVVIEAANPPVDTACGEGIMPDGVAELAAMGVELETVASRPFRGVRYVDGSTVAEGRFPAAPGRGIRRTVLHDVLRRRAEDCGVDLHWGTRVIGLADGGFETSSGVVRGRWLVGADGRTSRIRRWAGLDGPSTRRRRFGVRRHFHIEPWSDLVEVHWRDSCEAYVTPVDDRLVGVAMLWSGGSARFDELLEGFPELAHRLADREVASKDRGAGPLEQRCRRVTRGRLALVGDAAGYLDAITGEGLSLAFHQAGAFVEAIGADDLGLYRRAHRRIVRYPTAITRLLLTVERRPALRRRVISVLATDAGLMSRFLALKMRRGGPRLLGREGLVWLAARAALGGS